ncbi:hypothetical protein ACLB2K_056266 [Fragaria x ananassa]
MTFKVFRMLKSLHLQQVDVSGDVLGRLIACCPQLERMILCDLKGSTISSGKLLRYILKLPRIERLTLEHSLFEFGQDVEEGMDISWLDEDQKTSVLAKLQVVKVALFSGAKAEVDFIRFLLSSTSQMLERVILQPASEKISWEVFKLFPAFKRDSLHADLKFLDPSSPVQYHYESDSSDDMDF